MILNELNMKKILKSNKRILILDTIGSEYKNIHPKYRELFPNANFYHIPLPERYNDGIDRNVAPHGVQCAFCYLSQMPSDQGVDVYFLKILGTKFDFTKDYWWMEAVKDLKPDSINFSVGAHHGNSKATMAWLFRRYKSFARKFVKTLEDTDTQVFCAAGNEDSSSRGRIDRDNDVSFPQRLMYGSDHVHIIGSCDRYGFPSWFSSDGKEVLGMYWGDSVPVMHPFTGKRQRISGTSFSCPFAMADADLRNLKNERFFAYIETAAVRAKGWDPLIRHPKAGFGGMLPSMRGNFKDSAIDLFAMHKAMVCSKEFEPLAYFDLKKVN